MPEMTPVNKNTRSYKPEQFKFALLESFQKLENETGSTYWIRKNIELEEKSKNTVTDLLVTCIKEKYKITGKHVQNKNKSKLSPS